MWSLCQSLWLFRQLKVWNQSWPMGIPTHEGRVHLPLHQRSLSGCGKLRADSSFSPKNRKALVNNSDSFSYGKVIWKRPQSVCARCDRSQSNVLRRKQVDRGPWLWTHIPLYCWHLSILVKIWFQFNKKSRQVSSI